MVASARRHDDPGDGPRADWQRRLAAAPQARPAHIGAEPFVPELPRAVEQAPAGDGWLHETKWDGYRLLATIVDGRVRLWSRNGIEWTGRLPEIAAALAGLELESARLDGELVALVDGRSDFDRLQQLFAGEHDEALSYVLFDAPHLDGWDLSRTPLIERKALLQRVLARRPSPLLQYSGHRRGHGEVARAEAERAELEGVVSKRVGSAYRGGRSEDWLKLKRCQSGSFAVVGHTAGKGSRDRAGALLLARPERDGWRYVGRVDVRADTDLDALIAELHRNGRATPTVRLAGVDPLLRGACWVAPEAVVEVWYRGVGRLGLLRQPRLKGLRIDKRVEQLAASLQGPRDRERRVPAASDEVTISAPERLLFPADGIRKGQVADYYRAVADWLLPGIRGRPLAVLRCPEGLAAGCDFDTDALAGARRVHPVLLADAVGPARERPMVDDAAGLLELVELGALELHPWGCRSADPGHADRLVFGLDPGRGVGFKRVAAAARRLRALFERWQLDCFLRTTGGDGLHVVVPLAPAAPWAQATGFSRTVAETLVRDAPDEYVADTPCEGRIRVDWRRNVRGATAIASYSLRARPGAPAAVPLRWDELSRLERSDKFTIDSVPRRLARLDADPWEGIERLEQRLDPRLAPVPPSG